MTWVERQAANVQISGVEESSDNHLFSVCGVGLSASARHDGRSHPAGDAERSAHAVTERRTGVAEPERCSNTGADSHQPHEGVRRPTTKVPLTIRALPTLTHRLLGAVMKCHFFMFTFINVLFL